MAGDFPSLSAITLSQWPNANVEDPPTRGWYPPYAITLTFLATVILVARLWSQIKKSSVGLGIDDLLACIACLFGMLYTASSISGTMKFGFNRHIWDVPAESYSHAALVQWFSEGSFLLCTFLSKLAVLCFYRRLELPCTNAVKRIIYVSMAFTATYTLACLLTQVLLCRPTASYWKIPDLDQPVQRSCASQHIYYPLQGSLDAFSILYCILIPLLVLRNIPMSQFQRNGLRTLALAGLVLLGIGIVRAVFLSRLVDSATGDATWNGFNVFVLSQLECQLLIACASVPFLQRFNSQYPRVPIVYVYPNNKERNDSVMSRVSSSLSGQIKRLPFARSVSPRNLDISRPRPQAVEIPEWEFETLNLPRAVTRAPMDEHTYGRYVAGMYGPPVPPKDTRALFDQYRREHGEIV